MDKQEAKAELRKHVRWDEVSLEFVDTVPLKNALEVIDQLDTEEEKEEKLDTQELPSFINKEIFPLRVQDLSNEIIISSIIKNKFIESWVKVNPGFLSKALTDGWKVEEPSWVVIVNELLFKDFAPIEGSSDLLSNEFNYFSTTLDGNFRKFLHKEQAGTVAKLLNGEVRAW